MGRYGPELGKLATGEMVYDRHNSHLHGNVREIIGEALGRISAREGVVLVEQVDLGRVVGQQLCIETSQGDEIIFAQRIGRKGPTRFVLGKTPPDSSNVAVILKRDERLDAFVCLSAYVGTRSEPEPWDANATPESEEFWETHALIWDGSELVTE